MQWQFICWKLIKFEHCQFAHWHYRSYRNVKKNQKIFLFFPATVLPPCALPVLPLSHSSLCIWPPFSFSFRIVFHTCVLAFAFLQQCSLPRRWASGWRICPPMALCRCGKTGEPSTASRTTEKYRSTSLNNRSRCKTNVFEIRSAEDSHSDHVQQIFFFSYVSCNFFSCFFNSKFWSQWSHFAQLD